MKKITKAKKSQQYKYNPSDIEPKWQAVWEDEKLYHPDLQNAKQPFYNLMMFPYPSAEGLHVGNMFAQTGSDIYGRFMRMRGFTVFEPIGLDGFGIHSENYALKVGRTPQEHARISEKHFYEQMHAVGTGVDWERVVETYNPDYYKWTQWLFVKMFEAGVAYRKKASVNFCPKDLTVLADEQVIDGKCERCGTEVEKRELEQWFFKITKYADRLLNNIDKLDWSERVKTAQKQWIGKKQGINIDYPTEEHDVKRVILLHGKNGSPEECWFPWLRKRLEDLGYEVQVPQMPNPSEPNDEEQADYVQKHCTFDEQTAIVAHSFGGVVALRLLERGVKVKRVALVSMPFSGNYLDGKERPTVTAAVQKGFDFEKLKKQSQFVLLYDTHDHVVPMADGEELSENLDASLIRRRGEASHFDGEIEPDVFAVAVPTVRIFTTRPDTNFGATFIALAPEHPLALQVATEENKSKVKSYIEQATKKSEVERQTEGNEKTGVFTGAYAINTVTGYRMPIWVSDFVLMGFGTGALVGVPGHDKRDFEFAQKFGLEIKRVVVGKDGDISEIKRIEQVQEEEGKMVNSDFLNGMNLHAATKKIMDYLEENGYGERVASYHLRDWLISRQRYWGPPIPMIRCDKCGWQPVPADDLPVLLPPLDDWKPTGTGKGPLAKLTDWVNVQCPKCGGPAERETDVSDSFLDSSWYFFRYLNPHDEKEAFSKELVKKWLPVTMYFGGAEHSVLHLLYARFVTMVLHDLGYVDFEEPFAKFYAHGLLIKDGAKMSKSKGNVVVPDAYIKKYGADTLRTYLMFLGPVNHGGNFRDTGIEGMNRFLKRVWTLFVGKTFVGNVLGETAKGMLHKTIKGVTEDLENFRYNTAIAKLMTYYNFLAKQDNLSREEAEVYLKLLAPFAPHMTEELWPTAGGRWQAAGSNQEKTTRHAPRATNSIHTSAWPKFDSKQIREDVVNIPVQINGKHRTTLAVHAEKLADKAYIQELAKSDKAVLKFLEGKQVKQVIYVPGKIVNFVAY